MGCKTWFKIHSSRVLRRTDKQNIKANYMDEDVRSLARREIKASDPWTID